MAIPSLTTILSAIFIAYVAHSAWSLYTLFQVQTCQDLNSNHCLKSYLSRKLPMDLTVYSSVKKNMDSRFLERIWKVENLQPDQTIVEQIKVKIPMKTRKNGTLFVHVLLESSASISESSGNIKKNDKGSGWKLQKFGLLTAYSIKKPEVFQLVGNSTTMEKSVEDETAKEQPIAHWHSKLILSMIPDDLALDLSTLPQDLAQNMQLLTQREYMPILIIDDFSNRMKDLVALNLSCEEMDLEITYKPISFGKLRLLSHTKESLQMLVNLGFGEKDIDEVKGIFTETNSYLLVLTVLVSSFHLLFDFLAFKNEIKYWYNRESMVGLSTRAVIWRAISTLVIHLYLRDQDTSLLIVIPSAINVFIEFWKVWKAFKVKIAWNNWKPVFSLGKSSANELETEVFDQQAMKWLWYLLYPLFVLGAVYSLFYIPHKSWYSWCLESLVNGVYVMGFFFMLPQLFINYKLKSVAHLPWKAFMYKAFNTFIDDIFAFIISMPTSHRLACFRDDIIFLIYLYQRWLYPVDKRRVNEFGQSFEKQPPAEESKRVVNVKKSKSGKSINSSTTSDDDDLGKSINSSTTSSDDLNKFINSSTTSSDDLGLAINSLTSDQSGGIGKEKKKRIDGVSNRKYNLMTSSDGEINHHFHQSIDKKKD